jgi:hypothetical protein
MAGLRGCDYVVAVHVAVDQCAPLACKRLAQIGVI